MTASQIKTIAINTLKVLFAVGIIYWLVGSGKIDFSNLKYILSPYTILALLALVGLNIFIASERWRSLLSAQGFKISSYNTFKYTTVGQFFNFAVPGGVGGDFVKAFYLAKHNPDRKLKAVMTILIDRLVGLYLVVCLGLFAMLYALPKVMADDKLKSIFYIIAAIFVIFSLCWCVVLSEVVYNTGIVTKILNIIKIQKLNQLYDAFAVYRHHKSLLGAAFLYSLVAQSMTILFFMVIGHSLGLDHITWDVYFFAVAVGFMVTAIPISPAGVGVGQLAFLYLFNVYSHQETQLGGLGITVFQITAFIYGILGVYYYLQMGKAGKEIKE